MVMGGKTGTAYSQSYIVARYNADGTLDIELLHQLRPGVDGLVISFWMAKRRPEWYRAAFNMAAPAISIWVAAKLVVLIITFPQRIEIYQILLTSR